MTDKQEFKADHHHVSLSHHVVSSVVSSRKESDYVRVIHVSRYLEKKLLLISSFSPGLLHERGDSYPCSVLNNPFHENAGS